MTPTSAKHCSELHTFSYRLQYPKGWPSVTLFPDLLLVAKSEKASHLEYILRKSFESLTPVIVQELNINANDCVVCTIKIYLSCTKDLQKGRKCLFHFIQTTSHWRDQATKHVFLACQNSPLCQRGHKGWRSSFLSFNSKAHDLWSLPSKTLCRRFCQGHSTFCSAGFSQHLHCLSRGTRSDGGFVHLVPMYKMGPLSGGLNTSPICEFWYGSLPVSLDFLWTLSLIMDRHVSWHDGDQTGVDNESGLCLH